MERRVIEESDILQALGNRRPAYGTLAVKVKDDYGQEVLQVDFKAASWTPESTRIYRFICPKCRRLANRLIIIWDEDCRACCPTCSYSKPKTKEYRFFDVLRSLLETSEASSGKV